MSNTKKDKDQREKERVFVPRASERQAAQQEIEEELLSYEREKKRKVRKR